MNFDFESLCAEISGKKTKKEKEELGVFPRKEITVKYVNLDEKNVRVLKDGIERPEAAAVLFYAAAKMVQEESGIDATAVLAGIAKVIASEAIKKIIGGMK